MAKQHTDFEKAKALEELRGMLDELLDAPPDVVIAARDQMSSILWES